MMKGRAHRSKGSIGGTLAILFLLVGAALLFFPLVQGAISQASMNEEISRVQNLSASGSDDAESAETDGASCSGAAVEGDGSQGTAGDGGKSQGAASDGSDGPQGASAAASDGGKSQGAASDGSDGSQGVSAAASDGGDGSQGASAAAKNGASRESLNEAKEWLAQYNQKVAAGEISISADPFSFEEALDAFSTQGLEDGLIGYIEIPKMGCSLPLYLGASTEHMAKGATVVSGSSAPLGEGSSNCVIAAHRGYSSAAMFRDIEELSAGDKVYVCTLWDKLTYTVVGTKVIDPSDTAAVSVQQGRDMVSLLTCHPYGYNYSRYVVECERSEGDSSVASDVSTTFNDDGSWSITNIPLPKIEDFLRLIGGIALLACALILVVRKLSGGRRRIRKAKHR